MAKSEPKEIRTVMLARGTPISLVVSQLYQVRKIKGYGAQEIADLLGVSLSTINKVESGVRSPSIEVMEKYAAILGGEISFTGWR